MEYIDLLNEINGLTKVISSESMQEQLKPNLTDATLSTEVIKARLRENLDYLRVCIKYQVFDLNATRIENEYLRKILEEDASK